MVSRVSDFAAAGVGLSNGQELASVGTLPDAGSLMQALLAPHSGGAEVSHLSSGAVSMSNEQGIQLAVPLMLPDGGGVAGAMVLRVTPTDMRLVGVMLENVQCLGLPTLVAVLLLPLAFGSASQVGK